MSNEKNQAALSIVQQYPPTQYNLLVPMQTVTEIADIQKPVMNAVFSKSTIGRSAAIPMTAEWSSKSIPRRARILQSA